MDDQTRERKLHLAEMAAGAAILNGCDPDEVRARVEAGIRDAQELVERKRAAHATYDAPAAPVVPAPRATSSSVLDTWSRPAA